MALVDNLRRHFPAVRRVVFLDTASSGLLPDATVIAMRDSLETQLAAGRAGEEYALLLDSVRQEVREQLSAVFGGNPDQYALVDSTAVAMNTVLWGLPLEAGDEVIFTDVLNQDALLPVYVQKQRRGIVLKRLDGTLPEVQLLTQLESLLTPRCKVVITCHVSPQTGQRLPIEKMSELAHSVGAYCLVDGSHGAGAEPISLPEADVDFYMIAGHKWLCGPDGTGALYVRRSLLTVLDTTYVGGASLQAPHLYNLSGHFIAADDARKLEPSAGALVNWIGFLESLKFLRIQVGWEYVFSRIHGLSGQLMEQLLDFHTVRIVTPREARAGIVSFRVAGVSSRRVVEAARERDIEVQCIPERDLVRVSCGFYNSEDDLQRLCNLLKNPL
jgi:L-cysteine/cystine lyase